MFIIKSTERSYSFVLFDSILISFKKINDNSFHTFPVELIY